MFCGFSKHLWFRCTDSFLECFESVAISFGSLMDSNVYLRRGTKVSSKMTGEDKKFLVADLPKTRMMIRSKVYAY